jgi:hypothetical protein
MKSASRRFLPLRGRTVRKRLFASILLSAVFAFTTSCGITGVKQCRLEQRAVSASGQFVLADASTVSAHVDLAEQRQSSLYPSEARLLVGAQSYSLYGHMTHAELRDGHTPSRLFGSYLPGVGQETWAPNLIGLFSPYDWPLTIDEARALIESGELVLEIATDLPSPSLVRIPLTSTLPTDGTWFRERGESCG